MNEEKFSDGLTFRWIVEHAFTDPFLGASTSTILWNL